MYLYVRVLKGKHNTCTHVLNSIAAAVFKTSYGSFRMQKIHHMKSCNAGNYFKSDYWNWSKQK